MTSEPPPLSRLLFWLIPRLIAAIILVTAVWVALTFVPRFKVLVLYAVGRSECSFDQTFDAPPWTQRLVTRTEAMRNGSSKAGEQDGMQRWSTPDGDYWFAGAMPELFPLVLAEMYLDVYGGRRAISQDYVVLDCGADYGSFTRLALRAGAAKVVAIEVSPAKQNCLRRTFQKEIAAGRVVVYPKGVWNKDDQLMLRGDSVVFHRAPRPVPVQVTTIDKIVSELGLARIDTIKFDIEGAEANALRGAQNTLKQHRPTLLIASEHESDDITALPSLVKSFVPTYRPELDNCQDLGNAVKALTLRLSSR